MTRYVSIGHRLTGWNAVKNRVEQLKLILTDDQIKECTAKIKELADVRTQSMEDVDMLLRVYHTGIHAGDLNHGEPLVFDKLLEDARGASAAASPRPSSPSGDEPAAKKARKVAA